MISVALVKVRCGVWTPPYTLVHLRKSQSKLSDVPVVKGSS